MRAITINLDPCRIWNSSFHAALFYNCFLILVCERRLELYLFFNFHTMKNKYNLIRQASPHIVFGIASIGSKGSFDCNYPLESERFPDSIQLTRTKSDLNVQLGWIDENGELHGCSYHSPDLEELASVTLAIRNWTAPLVRFQDKPADQQPNLVGWCHLYDETGNKWVHQQYEVFEDVLEALWHCIMMLNAEGKNRLETHPFYGELEIEN